MPQRVLHVCQRRRPCLILHGLHASFSDDVHHKDTAAACYRSLNAPVEAGGLYAYTLPVGHLAELACTLPSLAHPGNPSRTKKPSKRLMPMQTSA